MKHRFVQLIGTFLFCWIFCAGLRGESLDAWHPIWSHENGAATAANDTRVLHDGKPSVRIEHRSQHDWSLTSRQGAIAVKPGDIIEISAWIKFEGEGDAGVSGIVRSADKKVNNWEGGYNPLKQSHDWTLVRARVIADSQTASIEPRLIGHGPLTLWFEGFSARFSGNINALRDPSTPKSLHFSNGALDVTVDTASATLSVTDRRNQAHWNQSALRPDVIIRLAKGTTTGAELNLIHVTSGLELKMKLQLDGDKPELAATLDGAGPMSGDIEFPHPFTSSPGTYLVVPMNEGVAYPVDDKSIQTRRLVCYGGHGICMAFFGVTDGHSGQMTLIETADDASIDIERHDGNLCIAPMWNPQKRQFGYARNFRYVFFTDGGHVAIAKRYRTYAKEIGLFKTLADKAKSRPQLDKLVGAVNTWCWDRDPVAIVKQMQSAGIEHILWSNAASSKALAQMNELGVLTGRYDIYQDVMDPSRFPELKWTHSDWPTAAWPKDIMIGANGSWIHGWEVEAKAGGMIPCGVTCDREAIKYAIKRIPQDLATHPYGARFIDTTTAAPWRECYSPEHPCTRTESKRYKMELLAVVSEKNHLVCGSETGHDAAVPVADYFEGMLSLGPYRVPDAGRKTQQIWTQVPESITHFMINPRYRLPLWELVYHDCLVAHWYWGDYNNKLPATWDARDRFNALYGTVPMFMFDKKFWGENKDRFAQSYQATCPLAREVGYSELMDHRVLSDDWSIQQTTFANGVTVTVDFAQGSIKTERSKSAR